MSKITEKLDQAFDDEIISVDGKMREKLDIFLEEMHTMEKINNSEYVALRKNVLNDSLGWETLIRAMGDFDWNYCLRPDREWWELFGTDNEKRFNEIWNIIDKFRDENYTNGFDGYSLKELEFMGRFATGNCNAEEWYDVKKIQEEVERMEAKALQKNR